MDLSLNAKTLGDIYNLPPEATLQGMDLLSQLQQGNQQYIQDRQQNIQQDQVMNPLRQQHMQGIIDSQAATLPGQQAQSEMLARKNKNESLLNDDQIRSLTSKYKSDELKNHMTDLDNLGTLSMQLAETTWANPLGAAARAKQQFEKSGHADMWNPQWDNLPPDQLAMQLSNMGKGLQGTSQKLNETLAALQAKGDNARQVEEIRAANREKIQSMKSAMAAELKKMTSTTKDPKSYQEAAVRYNQMAANETDPERRQAFQDQAEQYNQLYFAAQMVRSQATKEGGINPSAVTGLPGNPAPVIPTVKPEGQAKEPKPAKPPAIKEGDVYKGYRFKGGSLSDKNNWEKV